MSISDTSRTAQEVQLGVQRALSGEQRLLLAFEMSLFARDLARERIRRDHPEWDEAAVARELLRLAFLPAPPAREAAMSIPEVFQRITAALDQASIAYMLTGSFASAHYGAPRSTQDIDLVVEATVAQLRSFVQSLPAHEYYADLDAALEAHQRESMFNVIDLIAGWKIDLIFRKSRPFSREEFARRRLVNLQALPLFVASAEDVIIAKLEWAKLAKSQRQIEDAASVLRLRWQALDQSYLERWVSELGLNQEWTIARTAAGVP